jgi:diguanylate cyclase (GGDEF)-like protein
MEATMSAVTETEMRDQGPTSVSSRIVLVLREDGRIEMMSKAALDLVQDPVGADADRRADPMVEARCLWLASALGVIQGDSADAAFEKQLITRDGLRQFEVRLFPMVSPEGETRATGALLDPVGTSAVLPLVERFAMSGSFSSLSLLDQVTGLYNRRGLSVLAAQLFKLADRLKRDMAFLVCTVEGTEADETRNPARGEAAAKATARVLTETFHASDIIARVGRNAFAVLVVGDFEGGVTELAARLKNEVATKQERGEYQYLLSVEVGVVPYDPQYPRTVDELLVRIPGNV